MRPFSRRTRWLLIALAGAGAMLAGALPVLVSSGRPPTAAVSVQAGSVDGAGPESPPAPGDQAAPDRPAPPSSTTSVPAASPSIPGTTMPASAAGGASTAGGAAAACRGQDLSMNAGTDRVTYRPGDHIIVTATVTNNSTRSCWVTDQGTASDATSCDPQVLLQFYDAADNYDAVLGPYRAPCGPDPTVLGPGESTTAQVDIPFTAPRDCGPDPAAPACQLRAGSWTAVVNWQTGGPASGDPGMSAEPIFYCPPGACSAATSAPTGPSTTTTGPPAAPSSTTSSTTDPAPTSTTAPAVHKSSTTTTTAPATSTTTRRASRRAGG
ncbi:MAG TPA: hypothetical protein VFE55_22890 [Acidimicrobiia bacterium]|nr:hypothetical protein [Acidimicrobiia bacterium]